MTQVLEADRDVLPIEPGAILDAEDVVAMIADQNDREDPWEGPVPIHVLRFMRYRCAHVPIASIDLADHEYDPELAREYSKTPAAHFPPVVLDPIDRTLIEGYHRTHAGLMRGEDAILALVGIEADADPSWARP